MKVSVIVPVYNTEKYLRNCLKSLVNQSLKEIEIIIINDGSSDNSQLIIDEYCKNYPFVHGYKKENGGLGSARNFGLQFVKGDYIGFVDSDDFVEREMYEKMYNSAIKNSSDLVICDFCIKDETGNVIETTHITGELNKEAVSQKQYALKYARTEAVNKLYSRSLFFNYKIRYPAFLYEDYPITPLLIEVADKISYVPEPLYYYVKRKNSIMGQTRTFSERNFDILKGTELIVSSGHLFSSKADFDFYLDEVAPIYAFIKFYRDIIFLKDRKSRKKTIQRWGYELSRLLPGWYKSKAVMNLKKTIKNPLKKILFEILVYTFHTQRTFVSEIFLMLNEYLHVYEYENK